MARLRSREAETEDVNPRRLQRGAVKRTHISRWAVGTDEIAPGVVGEVHLHPTTIETIREVGAGSGVGQLLVVEATAQSFASGGAYVTADSIVYQHGFEDVTAAGDSIVWPVDAVGEIQVEFAWDTYAGGGTVELEVDGVVPAWGLVASGATGQVGCKRRSVHIAEGATVKVKVTQSSGTAKTADVHLEFSIPDPTLATVPDEPQSLPWDDFERAAGPLGTSTSGHLWTLRDTGPYDNNGNPIAQVPSVITLNGTGQAIADATLAATRLQFATIDHGTGDSPADGWEVGWQGDPGTSTGLGIVFRWQDATHYWNAFWYHTSGVGNDNYVYLERQNGTTFADASPRVNAVANNTASTNILRVVATGSSIAVYFNDVLKISETNSSFVTEPHHGISYYHNGGGIDWFGRDEFA